jgi:hypothetical protein
MSSADPAAYEKLLQYVERALALNPLDDSAAIIRRRSRLLGLEAPPPTKAPTARVSDPGRDRQRLLERLEAIRATFWTAPLAQLRASLEQLDASEFPDIQAVVRRLGVVAKHRDQFPRLVGHKWFDAHFLGVFKEVLIAAPREAAVAREKALAAFGAAKVRKSGSKMIRLIERELPYLFELESAWLQSLLTHRGTTAKATAKVQFNDGAARGDFHIPWWVWIFAIGAIRACISATQGP